MSTEKDDGGQAFAGGAYGCVGMSLRDYFAGQALAGWMATYVKGESHPGDTPEYAENIALSSYRIADAMLAARKEGQS
jgi:hypothetical protein